MVPPELSVHVCMVPHKMIKRFCMVPPKLDMVLHGLRSNFELNLLPLLTWAKPKTTKLAHLGISDIIYARKAPAKKVHF